MEKKELFNKIKKLINENKKVRKSLFMIVFTVVVFIGGIVFTLTYNNNKKTKILSQSFLEEIVNVDKLSTYQIVYNGVATVNNENKSNKVDYYVAYKAKVRVGIDFKKTEFTIRENEKNFFDYA